MRGLVLSAQGPRSLSSQRSGCASRVWLPVSAHAMTELQARRWLVLNGSTSQRTAT